MLERNDVKTRGVQELGGTNIIIDYVVTDLELYSRRVVINSTGVRHRDDARLHIGVRCSDRQMNVMRKGRYTALTREMVADERHSANRLQRSFSSLPSVGVAIARVN